MSKVRRFVVASLEGLMPGAELELPPAEARHVRVLRLQSGAPIRLNDAQGRVAEARIAAIEEARIGVSILSLRVAEEKQHASKLTIATAWPKGKRAGFMVEKCAELGVAALVPLHYERSVVSKDDESEGLVRLRRIAAEASKQSGRQTVMEIRPELSLTKFLEALGAGEQVLRLDPRGTQDLSQFLSSRNALAALTLLVGPEGGFSNSEEALMTQHGVAVVRMAENILRIETAAIAAAAIFGCRASDF